MHVTDWLFKDKHGKIAIMSPPNVPLWGFIACKLLAAIFKKSSFHEGFGALGTAFIFLWAYLEITAGESRFRRLLGAVVMVFTIRTFFRW